MGSLLQPRAALLVLAWALGNCSLTSCYHNTVCRASSIFRARTCIEAACAGAGLGASCAGGEGAYQAGTQLSADPGPAGKDKAEHIPDEAVHGASSFCSRICGTEHS